MSNLAKRKKSEHACSKSHHILIPRGASEKYPD
uniref:Uncharacterized protein n=1 Tax=Rhizophora mucronata TaxID=61149 RepID=A0A2P2QRN3_RHIMU